jgi:hypothetical protein
LGFLPDLFAVSSANILGLITSKYSWSSSN